ncbi:MAG TPA: c-type cytochrome [Bacteroidetes bacterium]|nr:c-type cytochrome [Bacteroidota bacterium]
MAFKRLTYKLLVILLSFYTFSTSAQEANVNAGKTLFKNNCAACHNKDMKSKMTGPALGGVQDRWDDEADLYEWIRNSQGMIASGNARATELWTEWKPTVMTSFPNLSDEDIANILAYVNDQMIPKGPVDAGGPSSECAVPTEAESGNRMLYVFLFVVLALLAVILARIISNLNYMQEVKETGIAPERKTLGQILTSKGVMSFVIFLAIVTAGSITVKKATSFGRQQGYQPKQPIAFSHITHACEHKIDCKYCHDGARRSKHSVIPAANTCMNCHKAIKYGSTYGTAELTKIYASVGFNPNTDKYIENYDQLAEEDIKKIFTRWISSQAAEHDVPNDEVAELEIDQWDGIVEALTDEKAGDNSIAGPIEWKRIHNLPDHVYFNHSQHVTVGKLECQQCHGKVEQMKVVRQYAPLSMGWCINCHRQTEVKFASNGYYDNYYENYHEEIKNLKRNKVTVEDIGGTECQKCHY